MSWAVVCWLIPFIIHGYYSGLITLMPTLNPKSENNEQIAFSRSLPALIVAWTEQLSATRAEIQSVLVALAHIQEHLKGTSVADLIETFDMSFDFRFRKYRNDSLYDLEQETESHLLAMLRAAAALHTDIHLVKNECISTVAALTDTTKDTVQKRIDQDFVTHLRAFPPPEHTRDTLRSFFRKKGK